MHSFDPQIAERVGVNAAVLYQNIVWWCQKNAANNHNEHDGRYWTYNSLRAWADLFPYLTTSQIRTALQKLEDAGLILSGVFNDVGYDRTKWYCDSAQTQLSKNANESAKILKPIPVSKPDIKPDTPPLPPKGENETLKCDLFSESEIQTDEPDPPSKTPEDWFEDFWNAYPKRDGANPRAPALHKFRAALKKIEPEDLIARTKAFAASVAGDTPSKFTPMAKTWLFQEGWTDHEPAGGAAYDPDNPLKGIPERARKLICMDPDPAGRRDQAREWWQRQGVKV